VPEFPKKLRMHKLHCKLFLFVSWLSWFASKIISFISDSNPKQDKKTHFKKPYSHFNQLIICDLNELPTTFRKAVKPK
jgi:hypothetical protein